MAQGVTENQKQALGLVEVQGLSLALVALDALEKAADVRVLEVELNDMLGALLKFSGDASAVRAAVSAAEEIVNRMAPPGKTAIVSSIMNAPSPEAWKTAFVHREFSPLLESEVVFTPGRA